MRVLASRRCRHRALNVYVWDLVEDLKAVATAGQEVDLDRLADPVVGLGDLV